MENTTYPVFPSCIGKLDENGVYTKMTPEEGKQCCQTTCAKFYQSPQQIQNCQQKCQVVENFTSSVVQAYKKRYSDGLDHLLKTYPVLFPIETELVEQRKQMLQQVNNLNQLAVLCSGLFNLPQTSLAFTGVQDMYKKPDTHMCFEFDQSPNGWYFLYGSTQNFRFTYIIFRTAVSPIEKSATHVLYSICGGFDDGTGWKTVPHNNGPGTYTCQSENVEFAYTSPEVHTQFSINSGLMTGSLQTSNGIDYNFTLKPRTDGHYNGVNGCSPVCFGGIGTSYWSYTNMECEVNNETGGLGWFDHQWINGGIPSGLVDQLLYSFVNGGKPPKQLRWFWLTIQLSDVQYALSVTLQSTDFPLKKGQTFNIKCNRYTQTGVDFNVPAKVEIKELLKYKNYIFPVQYLITVDKVEYILQRGNASTADVIIMPQSTMNWEGPGLVFQKDKLIGKGFLEANNLSQNSHAEALQNVGLKGELNDVIISSMGYYIIIFTSLFLLCLIVWLVYDLVKSRKKRK